MSYFPMFVELKDRCCLVVGGGRIALHKVKVMKEFGARIKVVAPEILPEIQRIEGVECCIRCFEKEDLNAQDLVIAATDQTEQNHRISQMCKMEKIPVNAVDQTEDCSFIFPAYLKEGEVVAAFSSGGQSPVIAQYLKAQMRSVLTPWLGELADCLGGIRKKVQNLVETEEGRREIYRELLQIGLERGTIPSVEEIETVIQRKSAVNTSLEKKVF